MEAWGGYEFEQRPDGLPGLAQAYGLKFAGPPRVMDLGLLYRVLNGRQVDMIAGNSTDGPIKAFHLTVLARRQPLLPSLPGGAAGSAGGALTGGPSYELPSMPGR